MQMRLDLDIPNDPKGLSQRHMDFIERYQAHQLEMAKLKVQLKLDDGYRVGLAAFRLLCVVLCVLIPTLAIYFSNKNIVLEKQHAKMAELGYDQTIVPGYSYPIWRKTNESRQNPGSVQENR